MIGMWVAHWVWRNGRRRRTYRFVRAAAMIGLSISAGL